MAWNRPTEGNGKIAPRAATEKSSPVAFIVILIAGVAVIGAACYFLFLSGAKAPTVEEETPAEIKPKPQAVAPKVKSLDEISTADKEFKTLSREDRIKVRAREIEARSSVRKYNMPTNWQFKGGRQKDSPEVAAMRKKFPPPVIPFDNPAEVTLMGLMEAADDDVHEERVIDKNFIKELRKSYDTPIEIKDEDSAVVKDEKAMMIELKEQLKPYLDRGDDEEVIRMLNEEQDNILKRQQMRRELEGYLREAKENGAEGQELLDYHDAVNRLMKEKGMSPIESLQIERLRRRVRRQAARQKGEESK